ncbi:MAG: DUF1385 domain-containing protein [Myxococcales bacterium]|jgi:uncharacterized protein YqhQ
MKRSWLRHLLLQARPHVGGQAVLEGVMMRSPKSFVVAVRRPDKQIVVREQAWETLLGGIKPLRWPLLRGGIVLIESLWNGISALNFSAEQAMPDDEGSGAPVDAPRKATAKERAALAMTLVVSLALGLGLFVGAPHLLTWLFGKGIGVPLDTDGFAFHVIDGVFKALIFVGYLALISRMPDIRRVFEYHGAEHKAIWAFEKGEELTPENAARHPTLHPRCGTSFILIVLLVSIVLFAGVFPLIPKVSEIALLNQLAMIGIKLPLMFPVAGLAYELQRWSARESCPRVIKWLVAPGLLLQRITTKEPSQDQLEIAVLSLQRALAREAGKAGQDGVALYRDFGAAIAAATGAPAAAPALAEGSSAS